MTSSNKSDLKRPQLRLSIRLVPGVWTCVCIVGSMGFSLALSEAQQNKNTRLPDAFNEQVTTLIGEIQ